MKANIESVVDHTESIYGDYMNVIRYMLLSEEVQEPTIVQNEWAQRAALGDTDLAKAIALLARTSELAFKQRYLDGMPMLNDFDSLPGGDHNGFEPIERFHFLRIFSKEHRQLIGQGRADAPNGLPQVLYLDPEQYNFDDGS